MREKRALCLQKHTLKLSRGAAFIIYGAPLKTANLNDVIPRKSVLGGGRYGGSAPVPIKRF